ncbi:MAG TPA: TIGR01777 family oxidoreductase [Acidobacteriota bacterium]|nr:TIGR01777 family oxidoreductase [Acidobacteriota bacterium]
MPRLEFETRLAAAPAEVFSWHVRPGAATRLLPPWRRARVLRDDGVREGTRAAAELRFGGMRRRLLARCVEVDPDRRFVVVQERGPFASFRHEVLLAPADGGTALVDRLDYELPWGAAGRVAAGRAVERELRRTFEHRRRRAADDIARLQATPPPARVVVGGASGLVGRQVAAFLRAGGSRVAALVRREPEFGDDAVFYDPRRGILDPAALAGADAVVHLAGAPIAARWTARRKREIEESRVASTRLVCEALAKAPRRPRALVVASAIGYYGAGPGDVEFDEDSPAGADFLADVCRSWEAATLPAEEAGVRVVRLRLGMVVAAAGGALAKMLPAFRCGLGGPFGDGRQWVSWIALDDVVGAVAACLGDERLQGAVNAVAPGAATNAEFARALGRALGRPAALPAPAAAVRFLFGEMGETMLLRGARVRARRLAASGFPFLRPTLESAFAAELGLPAPR